jgi:hypothetical protein
MQLQSFGTGQGFLKAGFFGFAGSGKTHTAMLLALELRKRLKLSGPIAIFDTEGSTEYIAARLAKETGQNPIGAKSRSLADLMDIAKQCEAGASPILIVDSATHVWREICDAYLDQVNKARNAQNRPSIQRIEFQDWANIKKVWARWTDFYLNSALHIIICGRAGFDWNFEEHEQTDGSIKKELVKTGTKMKVEGEFGFEPSLLMEMERLSVPDDRRPGRFLQVHRATVIKDRFDLLDGKMQENPTGEWFAPHIDALVPGAINVVDTSAHTDMGVDEDGNVKVQAERRTRTKLLEEIQGEITKAWPGQSAIEKKAKVVALELCFGTKSWTAVEGMNTEKLTASLAALRLYAAETTTLTGKDE